MFSQCHVVGKIFQNLCVRLKAKQWKLFVAREIQYFELRIFSFDSHVCYLTRGFIATIRAFNLPTRALISQLGLLILQLVLLILQLMILVF